MFKCTPAQYAKKNSTASEAKGLDKMLDYVLKLMIAMVFAIWIVVAGIGRIEHNIAEEHRLEGVAKSEFLSYYHGIETTPEHARHFNVVITTTDITVENLEVFQ